MGPFDRFNDRAKRVLALAQDEAIRFNHNYIGVEHLLLGLVREGEGVAARVLDSFGVELSKVRTAVEFTIGRGDSTTSPSEITLSPRTKRVIELAIDEARKLGHSAVGTEHLLLGIVREGGSVATGVLESLGVDLLKVRHQVIATMGQAAARTSGLGAAARAAPPQPHPIDRVDDLTRRVIALAENEALGMGHTWVGTEHLVLGLMSANGSTAQKILGELGLTREKIREHVAKAPPPGPEWSTPDLTMTPRAKRLLEQIAENAGSGRVRADPLLLAIVRDPESSGGRILNALSVTSGMIVEALGRQPPPS
ncbi:MAG TPA: Clp protease N-terminal domain-containing protein [Candidatus Limnocylindria bacterium]|nr:Clp protease N-terminal domain-containing protein [Candidatus Limnocylindria bacterium]